MESFEKGNRATIVRLRKAQEAIEKRERNALAAKIQARTAELEHELEHYRIILPDRNILLVLVVGLHEHESFAFQHGLYIEDIDVLRVDRFNHVREECAASLQICSPSWAMCVMTCSKDARRLSSNSLHSMTLPDGYVMTLPDTC